MDDRRDAAIIELAIDAARVTDDFVRGVLENAAGTAGGAQHVDRGWRRFTHLAGRTFGGERSVVRGMAARYGPEQLRKAAEAADDLAVALRELARAGAPAAREAFTRIAALGADGLPGLLRDPATTPESPALRDAHDRLSRTLAILNEARTAAILAEMRRARDQDQA
jgi:hypothetical protein